MQYGLSRTRSLHQNRRILRPILWEQNHPKFIYWKISFPADSVPDNIIVRVSTNSVLRVTQRLFTVVYKFVDLSYPAHFIHFPTSTSPPLVSTYLRAKMSSDSSFPPEASSATNQAEDSVRRWYSQSDEEFLKHVDRRNRTYRVGWPRLPPLPVSSDMKSLATMMGTTGSEEFDFWTGWLELESLAARCRGITHPPFFAYRRPVIPDPSETYLTLVFIVERPDKVRDEHILQFWKLLQKMDLEQKVSIEFVLEGVVDGFYVFPISPQEPFLMENYDRVYNKVLAEIQKQREDWTTVEIAHFGVYGSIADCPPTIIITTPTAAKDIWYNTVIPNLRRSLWGLPTKFRIEILCGNSLFIEPDFDRHTIEIENFEKDVTIGASISEAGADKGSATVGGMIKLANGMTYALSNDHVFDMGGLGKGNYLRFTFVASR